MNEIRSIYDISRLLVSGFTDWKRYGDVETQDNGEGLVIFCYSREATYKRNWNTFEQICRGLIINKFTGEIVALPFYKFFNWMEDGRNTTARISMITEKMDGSLGILYRDTFTGKCSIATKMSFQSEQAIWATSYLQNFILEDLPQEYTLLFEILYPENRIVVDYQGLEGLVLIAVRNRFTGEYLNFKNVEYIAKYYGFLLPRVYRFSSVDEISSTLEHLSGNEEGYVVEFLDGSRFKFKGLRYLELHKLISGITFKNTWKLCLEDGVDKVRMQIPEEFLDKFNFWVEIIETDTRKVFRYCTDVFKDLTYKDRKDFAFQVVNNYARIAPYLFAMLDGKDVYKIIMKKEFENFNYEEIG